MAYLFQTIIDELINNDAELIENFNNCSSDDLILIVMRYNHVIIIRKFGEQIVGYTESLYYKISSNLSLEKIIIMIWNILKNDYLNLISNPNSNQINSFDLFEKCKYMKFLCWIRNKRINSIIARIDNEICANLIVKNPKTIIFELDSDSDSDSDSMPNTELIIDDIIEHHDYLDIYYKL